MRAGILVVSVIVATGCASEPTASTMLSIERCAPATSNPYALGTVSVEGTELLADVTTGGGCGKHSFTMCWDGTALDSSPPTVELFLSHDGHGDTCDALLYHDLRVDLTPVLDAVTPPFRIQIVAATYADGSNGSVMVTE